MSVTIKTLTEFTRRAKLLAKRYKSFQADYLKFLDSIEKNPFQGVALGNGVYKIAKHRKGIDKLYLQQCQIFLREGSCHIHLLQLHDWH